MIKRGGRRDADFRIAERGKHFGPFHPAWDGALAVRARRGSCGTEYASAWVRKQGYNVGYRAVKWAFERYDRERRRVRRPPVQALVITVADEARAARQMIRQGYPITPWLIHPQLRMQRLLEVAGYRVLPEHPVGHYRVDCYLPDRMLAFECSEVYRHAGKVAADRDARRDRVLLERYGVTVVRLTDEEIYEWPVTRGDRQRAPGGGVQ
ncbi:MAG: DUF559 domain-containing protein [Chloroflexota bacterium]|nr:DUF559 domain-containing protein [Chloroflexota bacterium]